MTKKNQYLYEVGQMFKAVQHLPEWLKKMPPVHEQIRMIREALGMNQSQLAGRLKIRQNAIAQFENLSNGNLRIATLNKIAEALHCEVVVALVPKEEIQDFLERKALETAREILKVSESSNAIEQQKPEESFVNLSVENLKKEILEKNRKALWRKRKA